ncbi:MAG: DUF2130 domain-containing protein [Chitinophagaceae bacterium]|nr:DUF2130 domain-containing protein [Chitinophagaceae bacterium]
MNTNATKIQCPNCNTEIDVQNALSHNLEEKYKREFNLRIQEEQKKKEERDKKFLEEQEEFKKKKENENEIFRQRLETAKSDAKIELEKEIKTKYQRENSEQIALLQKALGEKSEQVRELNSAKTKILILEREKNELREAIKLESERSFQKKLIEEKEKIQKIVEEKNELKFRELQKQLEDQKKLTDEMKRKQEQGSMQLQGEVQELAIQEWLISHFPFDTIQEIKKGDRGADCLQIVHTRTKQNCGAIYYESKRTKNFNKEWIEKFKNDIREKAIQMPHTVGVLITDSFPSDMQRMGMRDGIWICSYEEFKGLCLALRETIIQISDAVSSEENKGEKMNMLYSFLTGNEFRLQIEAIVEGFTQMQSDLETEKRAMQGMWKKREKQIQKVILNTNFMYNSIKGIAGNAIQPVRLLEIEPDQAGVEYNEQFLS